MRKEEGKFVLVTRTSRARQVRARFASASLARFIMAEKGQSYEAYEQEEATYDATLSLAKMELGKRGHLLELERSLLPTYRFHRDDVIVVVGQDGLVANTLRYSQILPVIGVNPDPTRYEGTLLPFAPDQLGAAVDALAAGQSKFREVTLARAKIAGGAELVAANDIFVGKGDQSSARYEVQYRGRSEHHSSSGMIISTPLGSTAWQRSVVTGATGIVKSLGGTVKIQSKAVPWDARRLRFWTREPWPSVASAAEIVAGEIQGEEELTLASEMGEGGLVFADGMQQDALPFLAGSVIKITVAPLRARLVST